MVPDINPELGSCSTLNVLTVIVVAPIARHQNSNSYESCQQSCPRKATGHKATGEPHVITTSRHNLLWIDILSHSHYTVYWILIVFQWLQTQLLNLVEK